MKTLRVLHLEDNALDAFFVRRALEQNGFDAEITLVGRLETFLHEIDRADLDLVMCDNGLPGLSGDDALEIIRKRRPEVPFIFVTGAATETQVMTRLKKGATDVILKGQSWQLINAVRRAIEASANARPASPTRERAMMRLVNAVQELSLARSLDAVRSIVRSAARELTGADGASFVLRDGDQCHYADEDAIGPLWKGLRFPMSRCISGWVMLNKQPVAIEDVYADPRIPADAYRPTFVKSLVMVPIRMDDPIGAIGNYWASYHKATAEEIELLQTLANTTAVAMENVQLYAELEQRVTDRTRQLEAANRELEAFSYSVSHDLRAPLRSISGFTQLLSEEYKGQFDEQASFYFGRVRSETERMNRLIDDLMRLAKFARVEIRHETVDLSAIAQEEAARLQAADPERKVEMKIQPDLNAKGDPGLMRVVVENLLSNAWKYSSKQPDAVIEFGAQTGASGPPVFYVRDNGVGFEASRAGKLFAPFQRLHGADEFPGNGVGLATVQRIIHRHGGSIRAEAESGKGATFFFTVPGEVR